MEVCSTESLVAGTGWETFLSHTTSFSLKVLSTEVVLPSCSWLQSSNLCGLILEVVVMEKYIDVNSL
jgi:hypothetical protein